MADSDNYTAFTPRAVQTLADTVRAVRQMPVDVRGTPNPANSITLNQFFFPVQVKKDGGVAGSMATSTNCSFTYSLFDLQGNALKDSSGSPITGKTPDVPRFSNCKYDQPADNSMGVAYRDSSGTVHLLWAVQEKPSGATVNVVTTPTYNTGSNSWGYKTTPCLVLDKGNEGSETTYVTGSTCS